MSVALLLGPGGVAPPATAYTPSGARHGMVVSSNALASAVGLDVLRHGGNAVDAAVAVGFALAVVHPSAGNIGGGGFMLVRMADGRCSVIDYRETAPASAKRDMFLDAKGDVVPNLSTRGPLSAGVPGTVAGLALARERFGTRPLAALVQPAVDLARRGFVVPYSLYLSLADTADVDLQADFHAFPTTARIFLNQGQAWAPGDTLRQPELAHTLELIARHGPDAFYRGSIADLIERAMHRDGGLVTKADLAAYRPVVREPLRSSYRGYTLYTMPPPSSGGVLLAGMLKVFEADSMAALGHNSSAYVHRLAETWNRYYADRAYFLGDPDFVSVPVAGLASPDYAAKIHAQFDPRRHAPCAEIGHGDSTWLSRFSERPEESKETTHFCVVDRWGNAVSNTYTLNQSYGSRYVIEGAGFLINDEMDDFSAKPGAPNLYGLVGGAANAVEPGKRMLSSMTPTIVTKGDKLYLVLGSPGGSRIITSLCQVLLNVIDFGMGLQDAVTAPRCHSQWLPDRLDVEPIGFPRDVLDALTARGQNVYTKYGFWSEVQAIQVDSKRGLLLGAADPRGGASAALGY